MTIRHAMKADPTSERMSKLLALLAGRGEVGVAELAAHFHVAAMTIRRDLEHLARQGRVTRTHGGAMLAAPSIVAFAFHDRRQSRLAEKQAIAQAASRLVQPGMTVILDTGTTTLELARLLDGIPGLRVLTSSLAIASTLLTNEGQELVLLGGTVSKSSPDLSGPLTVENLGSFRAELAFIGADAVDRLGFYTSGLQIAQVSRAMIANAERTVLLADSGKFCGNAFVRIAGWEAVDQLIVDDGLAPDGRTWLAGCDVATTFAPISEEPKESP